MVEGGNDSISVFHEFLPEGDECDAKGTPEYLKSGAL
jgi:hypothetical protein